MKTNKTATDKSTPYRTNKGGRIIAPNNVGSTDPKSSKIQSGSDMRGGRSK